MRLVPLVAGKLVVLRLSGTDYCYSVCLDISQCQGRAFGLLI